MPIHKPAELLAFLDSLGIRPKKALSQNFLIDLNILKKIIATSDIQEGDLVVEIGPGPGALTELLLEKGAHVIAIEKDLVLAKALERFKKPGAHLTIHCADAMEFPYANVLDRQAKVVANLPYNITSPLLTKLLPMRPLFSHIHVMVQEEVGRRLTAKPATSDYGALTLFAQYYSMPSYAFTISKTCFFPAPKVNSAWISFALQAPPFGIDEETFFRITRRAFQQRRKMMRASLKELYPNIAEALAKTNLNPLARPEDLSLDDFVRLHAALTRDDQE